MAGGYRTPRNGEMGRLLGENADLRKRVKELEKPGQAEKSSIRRSVVGATLPGGAYRGAVLTSDVNGRPVWSTPIGSIVPKYWITLDPEGSSYYVARFGPHLTDEAAERMLPTPLFEYNQGGNQDITQMDWPIAWADEHEEWAPDPALISDPMPIQLEVYLHPRFEGQRFEISLPSTWMGSGGVPFYTFILYNETEYTADLTLNMDNAIYEGGVERPWRLDYNPGAALVWTVTTDYFTGSSQVRPAWWIEADAEGRSFAYPVDMYYWREVRALEQDQPFSYTGDLVEGPGGSKLHNARNTSVRVGKLTASVGTPPTGGPIEVQAYLHRANGTDVFPLFLTPLTIPAGEDYAEKIPDDPAAKVINPTDYWWDQLIGDEIVVLLFPGDWLTLELVTVGTGDPGSNLTVQAYYG